MNEVKLEDVKQWCIRSGYGIEEDAIYVSTYLWEHNDKEQIAYAIDNGLDVCTFDEWHEIQKALGFKMEWKTASAILNALWEDDFEVREIESYRNYESMKYKYGEDK